jgi:hypothetical protein
MYGAKPCGGKVSQSGFTKRIYGREENLGSRIRAVPLRVVIPRCFAYGKH